MSTLKQRLFEIAHDLGSCDPIPNTYFQKLLGLSSGRISQLFLPGAAEKLGAGAIGRLTKYGYSADWIQTGKKPKKIAGMADLLPSPNTPAPEDEAKSTPPESSEQGKPADIHILKDRRKEDHQAIAEVLKLMLEMDDHGKWEVVVRAKDIAKERAMAAKANAAESSQ